VLRRLPAPISPCVLLNSAMTTETTWYPFPGLPDYEFSNEGDLRTSDGQILSLQFSSNGQSAFYAIPHLEIKNHFIHITPDEIIDDYLPNCTKD